MSCGFRIYALSRFGAGGAWKSSNIVSIATIGVVLPFESELYPSLCYVSGGSSF
ncbi:hypothetical protein [Ureibacillus chungkukjangi]|uniref:hypothetical protein n=1 Tax=Ureibacillus chungkukjangi TaxID=1202712 RepID=UPI0015E8A7E8|nr:hypothetical protein [Ureibacillus chungkukjangi]